MGIGIITVASSIFLLLLYERYMPVYGIGELDSRSLPYSKENVAIVDTRSYQTSFREALEHTYCLPLPYLNRHFHDLPNKDIIIIASNNVERNLSARILQRKGMRIIGYCLAKEDRKEQ